MQFYVGYCTVCCLTVTCFMSFVLCFNHALLLLLLVLVLYLFSSFVCFVLHFMCSISFCIVLCSVSHVYSCFFLLVYKFTDYCNRVENQMQLINIISYFSLKRLITSQIFHVYLKYTYVKSIRIVTLRKKYMLQHIKHYATKVHVEIDKYIYS